MSKELYKLKHLEKTDLAEFRKKHKDKKIVFTYGTYDLIHSGHAIYLLKARASGDILVVGVATNESKKRVKTKRLPLIDEINREEQIQYFDFVDNTVLVDVDNLTKELSLLKPDVFFTLENDWITNIRTSAEQTIANDLGIKVIKTQKDEIYVSASDMINRVADVRIKSKVEYFFGKTKIDLSKGDWSKKKWSSLKTDIRDDTLYFGKHIHKAKGCCEEYIARIVDYDEVDRIRDIYQLGNKKIVLAMGTCDLLHAGHTRFFQKAKDQGDILVLGIPTDRIVRRYKGAGRPVITEYSRAELMSFFRFTDFVVIYDEKDVKPFIEKLKPDIFFTINEDWNEAATDLSYFTDIKDWKGKVVGVEPQSKNLSSNKLIRKATGLRLEQLFGEELNEASKTKPLKDW